MTKKKNLYPESVFIRQEKDYDFINAGRVPEEFADPGKEVVVAEYKFVKLVTVKTTVTVE